ncbi:hypothetical protein BRD13_01355 [Halobacteriales archaeon SW_5_70_135]|nr:MAG: hypothetical protein BRD13_01355 [Halobacteriales archaeon SW_5_70_135]
MADCRPPRGRIGVRPGRAERHDRRERQHQSFAPRLGDEPSKSFPGDDSRDGGDGRDQRGPDDSERRVEDEDSCGGDSNAVQAGKDRRDDAGEQTVREVTTLEGGDQSDAAVRAAEQQPRHGGDTRRRRHGFDVAPVLCGLDAGQRQQVLRREDDPERDESESDTEGTVVDRTRYDEFTLEEWVRDPAGSS